LRQRKTAFEAQGHQQVKREKARNGGGNFEVGFDGACQHAKDEKEDGGIDQILHGVFLAPILKIDRLLVKSILTSLTIDKYL
jgi:hypothetical protein